MKKKFVRAKRIKNATRKNDNSYIVERKKIIAPSEKKEIYERMHPEFKRIWWFIAILIATLGILAILFLILLLNRIFILF